VKTGERLFRFLAGLILDNFYGKVIISFEHGKVSHVEMETRRHWQYRDLPQEPVVLGSTSWLEGEHT